MAEDRRELSSPACAANQADDAYMGFAGKAEVAAFLADVDATNENNRATVMARLRELLPRVRDDVLHSELSAMLRNYESRLT